MLEILRRRLKGVVADPALCPSKFSFEAPIRTDRRHWPSSVCFSFLGPSSHVVRLPRPVHDEFVDQPQPVVRTQTSRLSTRLQSLSDMLRCELAVVKFSITGIQDTLNCDSTNRSHCHLEITELFEFRVFDPHPIFPTQEFSSSEYYKMESRAPLLPSCCFGKHVQDLLSKFQIRCVVLSSIQSVSRRLSVTAAPVHQVRSEFHQPAKYPRIREGP